MLQANQTTVSRNAFIAVCAVAAALLLALVICIFRPLDKSGELTELNKVIASIDPPVIALITEEAEFKLLFQDGSAAKPCGIRREGTELPDSCNVDGKFTHVNNLSIASYEGSDCGYGSDGPGHTYTYHLRRPNRYGEPCHHPHQ